MSLLLARLAGGVDGTAVVSGVSVTSAIGTVVAIGDALIIVSGVSTIASVGTVIGHGDALTAVSGVSASSAIGTVTATGDALTVVTGVQVTAAVGDVIASGPVDATVVVTGVEVIASVGNVLAFEAIEQANTGGGAGSRRRKRGTRTYAIERPREYPAIALPDGVVCASVVGKVLAFGAATAIASGTPATSAIGDVDAHGVQNLTDEELLLLLAAA